ncbi:MAG TPA: class I SAM-dependent methyltransferase [Candidatus Tyrphobacter sp.]
MRNIVHEKPTDPLHGRLAFSVEWVADEDIRGKDVLDIGCGYGWFEYHALQRGVAHVTGTERTDADLATVKEHIGDPRATFSQGSALALPCDDATFDTAVAWEVIEHIPKRTEPIMFREVYRVLRPGGAFYLSTPYQAFASNVTDPAWWSIGHRHYSKERLRALAEPNGFEIAEMFPKAGLWSIAASLDMYLSKWVLRRRPLFANVTTRKEEEEFARAGGFVTLFAKCRKR